ncbi:hypothetical protein RUM44_003774 [Polyplax serrata]|uniref:Piezo THU9 and anchor domain-containing protein n=1 Tax=Polyplax serrata TaxID=468196 RepID=A0ABR1AHG1_POLSC
MLRQELIREFRRFHLTNGTITTNRSSLSLSNGHDTDRLEEALHYRYSPQATFDKFPTYFNEARVDYCSTTKNFFSQLLDTGCRISADIYAYNTYQHLVLFMAVPFLFELRALMDWIWTDTSMTLSDWLKMEDIFAQIFQLKCQRRAEAEYPLPRGERKSPLSKYLLGGAGLFMIIAIIWFPLVLFALGNTVGESNIPYDVTISLRIGAYQYLAVDSSEFHRCDEELMFLPVSYCSFLSEFKAQKSSVVAKFV